MYLPLVRFLLGNLGDRSAPPLPPRGTGNIPVTRCQSYIPHIADVISREFPRSHGSRLIALPRHAEQIEHLSLQVGEFGREELDGLFATHQRMALGEAE